MDFFAEINVVEKLFHVERAQKKLRKPLLKVLALQGGRMTALSVYKHLILLVVLLLIK